MSALVVFAALLALVGVILGAVGVHKASAQTKAVTGPPGPPGPPGSPGTFPTGSAFLATYSNKDGYENITANTQGVLRTQFDVIDTAFSTADAAKQYNVTTGVYTIPKDGYYVVSYSLNAQGNGSYVWGAINVNRTPVRFAGAVLTTDKSYSPVNDTGILYCTAGDAVQLSQGVLITGTQPGSFATFLYGLSSFSVVFLR